MRLYNNQSLGLAGVRIRVMTFTINTVNVSFLRDNATAETPELIPSEQTTTGTLAIEQTTPSAQTMVNFITELTTATGLTIVTVLLLDRLLLVSVQCKL